MSFACELTRYHTSSAGTWYTRGGLKGNENVRSFFRMYKNLIAHCRRLCLFSAPIFRGEKKEEKTHSKNMQKTRESNMIIANIHRQSYNTHVCSLQKSWLHQTGVPSLVCKTPIFVHIWSVICMYGIEVYSRATGSKKKVARARECGKCDEHVWKFHFNAGKQPTGTTHTNTHTHTCCEYLCLSFRSSSS